MSKHIYKKALALCCVLSSLGVVSCGNSNSNNDKPNNNEPNNNEEDKTPIDYGTISVPDMILYEGFDGIKINPIFSNPEACANEVFYFEPEDNCCVVDDEGRVYYVTNGKTKINYESEHLNGSFEVTCMKLENTEFKSKAKSYINSFKNDGMPTGSTLFLGDSFFEFWKNKTGIEKGFYEEFADYNVRNIGISATQTKHWRAYQNSLVRPMEPKNVVINIGINDIDDSGYVGERAARNIQTYIRDIHEDFPDAKIYWFTLTRCSGVFANKWGEYKICNKKMMEFATKNDYLTVLDIASEYGDNYASYQQDGLHPNQKGYDLFKKMILDNVSLEKK